MKALVGLGNPGPEYAATRHNLGFRVVDAVAAGAGARRFEHRGHSLERRVRFRGTDLVLVKPVTFMNRSGYAVAEVMDAYDVRGDDLIVAHDDLDIELGRLRIKLGGGHGGHRGVESIIEEAGTGDFVRLRLGIRAEGEKGETVDYVLSPFEPEEQTVVESLVSTAVESLGMIFRSGVIRAMNAYNRKQSE